MKKTIFTYFAFFFGFIFLFFSSMVLVHCIPSSAVEENMRTAVEMIDAEGDHYTPYHGASSLDSFTDKLMITTNKKGTTSDPIFLAIDNQGYSRYWHGYQIVLRPMLAIFTYAQIRQINTLFFFFLLCLAFSMIRKKINLQTAIVFLITMACMGLTVIPISLQFSSVFNILLLFTLYLLRFRDISNAQYIPLSFMIVGMTTNFFDLLTSPILTLGIPLVILICLYSKHTQRNWFYRFKKIISCSLFWVIGYGACWISKWAIASLVTRTNVFESALEAILFRSMGNEQYPVDRFATIQKNLDRLFQQNGSEIILCTCFILLAVLAITFRPRLIQYKDATLFIGISTFSFVWYFCLANHSDIHDFFTFRTAGVAIFALLTALTWIVDWNQISVFYRSIKNKIIRRKTQ